MFTLLREDGPLKSFIGTNGLGTDLNKAKMFKSEEAAFSCYEDEMCDPKYKTYMDGCKFFLCDIDGNKIKELSLSE